MAALLMADEHHAAVSRLDASSAVAGDMAMCAAALESEALEAEAIAAETLELAAKTGRGHCRAPRGCLNWGRTDTVSRVR